MGDKCVNTEMEVMLKVESSEINLKEDKCTSDVIDKPLSVSIKVTNDDVIEDETKGAESVTDASGVNISTANDSLQKNASKDSDSSVIAKKIKFNRKSRHNKKGYATAKDVVEKNTLRRMHHANFKSKIGRKRCQTFPSLSKFYLPYKRPRKEVFIPPTKFLLGGNISDPLNLNSLQDEDINRAMNAVTPKSSPLPTPPRHKAKIDVIIPPDIRDPLNLLNPLDNEEYEKQLETQKSKKSRKRWKAKRRVSESTNVPTGSPTQGSPVKEESVVPAETSNAEGAQTAAPPTGEVKKELKLDLTQGRGHKRSNSESESGGQKCKDNKKLRRMDSLDKIVSPVVPQPGAWMRVHPRGGGHAARGATRGARGGHQPRLKPPTPGAAAEVASTSKQEPPKMPRFKPQNSRYEFGNYDRYYGYRNLNAMMDVRLRVFEIHKHLFLNKEVLDIGCNVGHISIAVARELGAKSVTGIDIDEKLIVRARKNLSSFVTVPTDNDCMQSNEATMRENNCAACKAKTCTECRSKDSTMMSVQHQPADNKPVINFGKNKNFKKLKKNRKSNQRNDYDNKFYFPISFTMLYGPIQVPGYPLNFEPQGFPHNIVFKQANYILKDEALLNAETPQYDLIMCLSTTKWFHLNWGDAGIKMAFKRMFAELKPGGKLILEAQNWASYSKRKRLTETIYKNYNSIEFFPNKFREYLLSPEVGFSKCCVLGVPQHLSKGFRRPIQLYIKGDFTPSKAQWSDTYAPSSHHRQELGTEGPTKKVYATVMSPMYHPSTSQWSGNNTPSYGAATPYSFNQDNSAEESPFYNPRSDSYTPSYSSSGQVKNVYATLASPQSDPGGTPGHVTETNASNTNTQVYTSMASPASPFLEPSPGNSTTPSHPFTPSHSASYDNTARKKVYASLHSPQPDGNLTPHHPVYSPSVAGHSSIDQKYSGGHSPLYTGSNLYTVPEGKEFDVDNTSNESKSNESIHVKDSNTRGSSVVSSPAESEVHNSENLAEHLSPSGSVEDAD